MVQVQSPFGGLGFIFSHKMLKLMIVVGKKWGQNCPQLFLELANVHGILEDTLVLYLTIKGRN
jgi:hypothetical protein